MSLDLSGTLAVLERTPGALRSLLAGLPDAWIRADEGPGTWSPYDVVGHLVDGEAAGWLERARIFLAPEGERRFGPFPRSGRPERDRGRDLPGLLDEFARLRATTLADVRGLDLTPAHLARTAEHPELGGVTLAQLLAAWCVHDLDHLGQVARVMARRYADEVGPWRKYLTILHR